MKIRNRLDKDSQRHSGNSGNFTDFAFVLSLLKKNLLEKPLDY